MTEQQPSSEEITKHYSAMLDSANFILSVSNISSLSEQQKKEAISRNAEHLKLMKSKPFWVGQDFSLVDQALLSAEALLAS